MRALDIRRQFRRYLPFYVFGAAFVLMMALLPTPPSHEQIGTGLGVPGAEQQLGGPVVGRDGEGQSTLSIGTAGTSSDRTAQTATEAAARTLHSQTGITRGGFECRPGVGQVPGSSYAPPCRPKWTGRNPGTTYPGVTSTTIKIVSRDYTDNPGAQAIYAAQAQAGEPPKQDIRKMRNVFVNYFNKVYELYGRRVVLEDYRSNADPVAEVSNEGHDKACADAAEIAEEREAFGVLPPPGFPSLGPFSECAAERRMFVPIGPYAFPEDWYRRHHPYAWGVQMECERVAYLLNEYSFKRLVGRKAAWAADAGYRGKPRVFGSIRPDIDAYRPCVAIVDAAFKRRGIKLHTFDYTFDPATMAQQATQAVSQFKEQGVTTLLMGSDFLMNIHLTQQSRQHRWGPEWIILGAGFQDIDNYTRLYDQDRVDGHMFGLSQLGSTQKMRGPNSEPGKLYRKITGEDPPPGTDGEYFNLVQMFNLLQEAGPDLRPQNMPKAAVGLPPAGAPGYPHGLWSFRSDTQGRTGSADHTAVDDAREVFWDATARGYDGKSGTYLEANGGRRFSNGQMPSGQPNVYPDR